MHDHILYPCSCSGSGQAVESHVHVHAHAPSEGGAEHFGCLAHFDPIWRNWFHLSRLMTIVAIGLQKPYSNSESGTNLLMYDVY